MPSLLNFEAVSCRDSDSCPCAQVSAVRCRHLKSLMPHGIKTEGVYSFLCMSLHARSLALIYNHVSSYAGQKRCLSESRLVPPHRKSKVSGCYIKSTCSTGHILRILLHKHTHTHTLAHIKHQINMRAVLILGDVLLANWTLLLCDHERKKKSVAPHKHTTYRHAPLF